MLKHSLIVLTMLIALGGGYAVARRGTGLENRILRAGGAAIQMLAQRPRRTITGFACAIAGVWGVVAIVSALESRRKRSKSLHDQTADSPASGSTPEDAETPG